MATDTEPRRFAVVPQSALQTMTWAELWVCEDEAIATGDEEGRRAVQSEIERRRAERSDERPAA
jgi:hypothetical protein